MDFLERGGNFPQKKKKKKEEKETQILDHHHLQTPNLLPW